MRLNRLDLVRYGKFEDVSLDFGVPGVGPDLAVVYGDNEAGKSTAHNAWLDFLFGIELRTRYAYRFERRELLIGAEIATREGTLTLQRNAKSRDSLLDDGGRAISQQRLSGLMFGLDRASYRTRFSLDEAELRGGGEEIARARGDLGRLLHAGTSGLAGLSEALAALEAEIDGFHKKGGRATRLAAANRDLKALNAQVKAARLDPRRFDELNRAAEDAQSAREAAARDLDAAKRALRHRDAADARRRIGAEIAQTEERLSDSADGPDLSGDAVTLVITAEREIASAAREIQKARQKADDAKTQRAKLSEDPEGLRVAALVEALEEARFEDRVALLSRVQAAEADLASRRQEQTSRADEMADLARRLRPDLTPDTAKLPLALIETLREQAEAARDAARSLADAARAQKSAVDGLGPRIEPPQGLPALDQALTAFGRDGAELDGLEKTAAAARLAASQAAVGLPTGWVNHAAELPEAAEIAVLASREVEARAALRDATVRQAELEAAVAETTALLETARQQPDAVSAAAIEDSRAGRDATWATHRATLDATTADTFEAHMREDDRRRADYAQGTETRLDLSRRAEDHARAEAALGQHAPHLARAHTAAAAAAAEVARQAEALGLSPDAPGEALAPRRAALAEAAMRDLAARTAEHALAAAREKRARLVEALANAVEQATGTPAPPDRLEAEATLLAAELTGQANAARAWQEARRSLERLEANRAEAQAALDAAEVALAALLQPTWLEGMDAATVLAVLPRLDQLDNLAGEHDRLRHRIAAMEAAMASFRRDSQDLRAILGLGDDTPSTALLAAARNRANAAKQARETALRLAAAEQEAEAAIADWDARRQAAQDEIAQELQGQTTDLDLSASATVRRLEKRDQDRATLARLTRDLTLAGEGLDPETLAAEAADPDPLRRDRLAEMEKDASDQRDRALVHEGEAKEALRAALTTEGGAALDQERAALLADLREEARAAATQLVGLMAAQGALRRFREDHKGPMLAATERAFRHLTHGEWQRLETRAEGRDERLVGIRDGQAVAADAMSTGTRGQLYLALRIAGHAVFTDENGPLPFITDDIHETFDNRRAKAALELAAEMGALGQCILFTHHRHLLDLARQTLPGVRIIEIDQ